MRVKLIFLLALIIANTETHAETIPISFHANVQSSINENRARSIVSAMNTIMDRAGNGCEEINFEFSQLVKDSIFPVSIDSKDQINSFINNRNNFVFFVEYMNYCEIWNTETGGCSTKNTSIFAENQGFDHPKKIMRTALIIAHEFGHTAGIMKELTGLSHSAERKSLMSRSTSEKNSNINANECAKLRRTDNLAFLVSGPEAVVLADTEENLTDLETSDLEDYLDAPWPHGPVKEEALRFADQLDDIREILLDNDRSYLWEKGVLALGMLGLESDIDFMIWYYDHLKELGNGESIVATQVNFPIGLSILADEYKSTKALNFLSKLTQLEAVMNDIASDGELAEVDAGQVSQNAFVGINTVRVDRNGTKMSGANSNLTALEAVEATNSFGPDFTKNLQDVFERSRDGGPLSVFGFTE